MDKNVATVEHGIIVEGWEQKVWEKVISSTLSVVNSPQSQVVPCFLNWFTYSPTGQNVFNQMDIGYFQYKVAICQIKEEKLYLGQICHMDELSLSCFSCNHFIDKSTWTSRIVWDSVIFGYLVSSRAILQSLTPGHIRSWLTYPSKVVIPRLTRVLLFPWKLGQYLAVTGSFEVFLAVTES